MFGSQGPDSIKRSHLTSIGNPIVEIRRSYDRLISTIGFPIPVRWHLYIESGPWYLPFHWLVSSLMPCTLIPTISYMLSREYRAVSNRYSRLLFTSEDCLWANLRVQEQSMNMTAWISKHIQLFVITRSFSKSNNGIISQHSFMNIWLLIHALNYVLVSNHSQ